MFMPVWLRLNTIYQPGIGLDFIRQPYPPLASVDDQMGENISAKRGRVKITSDTDIVIP